MIEKQQIGKDGKVERAVLVGIYNYETPFERAKEYLDELAFLVQTAGGKAVSSFLQNLNKPVNSTFVGSGKLEEIKQAVEDFEADLVVFDADLSPSQTRNIDKVLDVKVLDRSAVILHIFSEHARTAQARIQVDLAQYQYMLPRLAGLWTHLSKQKGGIGLKGAGEKEIETDRRIIRQKISDLKKELAKIEKQSANRRKNRGQQVRVSLVGYTNVGKSTLMNLLSKSDVLAENKLFATLDTTVRKVVFDRIPFLISDTVGFIRKLPHHLIECFNSTLAEAQESDIIVHVVDAAHPQVEDHIRTVKETLQSLGIEDKPILTVFNKIDCLSPEEQKNLSNAWYVEDNFPSVNISAAQKLNIDELRKVLTTLVAEQYAKKFPQRGFMSYY